MKNRKNLSLVARDVQICDLRLNKKQTTNEIGKKYGLDARTVYAILERNNLHNSKVPKRSRKYCDQKPLSGLHAQIGNDINHARLVRFKQSIDEFANAMGMSRMRLRKIEIGIDDLTLSELFRVATAIGVPVETLLTARNQHVAH